MKHGNENKDNVCFLIVCLIAILLGITATSWAEVPYQFSPGTTIKSQEVNDNFEYLNDRLTVVKQVFSIAETDLPSYPDYINILSITVKPPIDGIIFLFGNAVVRVDMAQANVSGGATLGISTSSEGFASGFYKETYLSAPGIQSDVFMQIPVSIMATFSVDGGTEVSYYLKGRNTNDPATSRASRASLIALFIPGSFSE